MPVLNLKRILFSEIKKPVNGYTKLLRENNNEFKTQWKDKKVIFDIP
jgi:hypothetical protein